MTPAGTSRVRSRMPWRNCRTITTCRSPVNGTTLTQSAVSMTWKSCSWPLSCDRLASQRTAKIPQRYFSSDLNTSQRMCSSEQPAVLDRRTPVHHHRQPCRLRSRGGGLVNDTELHPYHLHTDGNRLVN